MRTLRRKRPQKAARACLWESSSVSYEFHPSKELKQQIRCQNQKAFPPKYYKNLSINELIEMMYSHHLGCYSSGLVRYSDVRIPRFGNSPEDNLDCYLKRDRKILQRKA